MRKLWPVVTGLALLVGAMGCFVPVPVHEQFAEDRFEAEHRDPHIVVIESEPPPERGCWQHGNHWHCHHDDD